MKRSSKVRTITVKPEETKQAFQVELKHVDFKEIIKMGLEDFVFQAGMIAVQSLMEQEAESLAGPRYARSVDKECYRWGTQKGAVFVQGQKKSVERPRVMGKRKARGKLHETELSTYKAFSQPDAMNEAMLAKLMAGVSTRDYASTVEQVVDGHGISRSAVSRRAVEVTGKMLEAFYTRRLDEHEFVVIMIDGVNVKDSDNIVALGVDVWGKKTVLGMRQGATETSSVCIDLLQDLIERGLPPDEDLLFVLDGAKALYKAVKKVFGKHAVIQRCQLHKRRNVQDKLPNEHQTRIDKKLAAAYGMNGEAEARKALESVYEELIDLSEQAAGSLEEGMEDTLTVHKLGIGGDLKKILSSTNCIESMFSMARRYKRNVKRWRNYKHIERTLVSALLEAEQRFRRIKGYRELKDLKKKIQNFCATTRNTEAA